MNTEFRFYISIEVQGTASRVIVSHVSSVRTMSIFSFGSLCVLSVMDYHPVQSVLFHPMSSFLSVGFRSALTLTLTRIKHMKENNMTQLHNLANYHIHHEVH